MHNCNELGVMQKISYGLRILFHPKRRQIFSPMHNIEEKRKKRMASQKQTTTKGTKHIFRIVNRKMVLDVHELQRQRAKLQRSDAIFSNNLISRISSSYQGITPLKTKIPFPSIFLDREQEKICYLWGVFKVYLVFVCTYVRV